ncbi:MAG TPA: hypothetical protein PKE69_06225 [Pyrinomonadaceae bacterium]|mgnify:CR=1 FL=1|nr:hypothetical protein [Pyrinomonadaceae bacterium]
MKKTTVFLFIVLFVSVNIVYPFFNYYIEGGATHSFNRGVPAGNVMVQIRGNGNSNLDLYVYYGSQLIGRGESAGDGENVPINTNSGGAITILVVNRGRYGNQYQTNF